MKLTNGELNVIRLALSSMLVEMRDRDETQTALYSAAESAYLKIRDGR